jgi:hypothetical protein
MTLHTARGLDGRGSALRAVWPAGMEDTAS